MKHVDLLFLELMASLWLMMDVKEQHVTWRQAGLLLSPRHAWRQRKNKKGKSTRIFYWRRITVTYMQTFLNGKRRLWIISKKELHPFLSLLPCIVPISSSWFNFSAQLFKKHNTTSPLSRSVPLQPAHEASRTFWAEWAWVASHASLKCRRKRRGHCWKIHHWHLYQT